MADGFGRLINLDSATEKPFWYLGEFKANKFEGYGHVNFERGRRIY